MPLRRNTLQTLATCFYCLLVTIAPVHAGTPLTGPAAVEAEVTTEVTKDLALPYNPQEELSGRTCLDGRPVADFQGEIVEYWANLEWCAV